MRSNFASAITISLFAAFVWSGYKAGWFAEMWNWQPSTWALWFGVGLVAWIGRNEFGGGHG